MGTKKQLFQKITFLLLLMIVLSASECDFDFTPRDPCSNEDDVRRCYQNLAVDRGDPSYCEKITALDVAITNPERDKCYLMVAESTGDANHCLNIIGSKEANEKNDCIMSVAVKQRDFDACNLLKGNIRRECYANIGKTIKVTDLSNTQDKIRELERQLTSDWRNDALKKELAELKRKQDLMYENAPGAVRRDYFRQEREKLFEDVTDSELRSMIAQDFTQYRGQNSDATVTELIDKMNEIKEEKQIIQRLDQEANKLIDDLKNNIIDYGSGNAKDAVDGVAGAAWAWSFSKGSEEMKWQMSRLERMKDQYDRTSAQYKAINDKIDQFKKVYDEVSEVYTKVNQFNQLLADGEIEEGHAEVLKGAVYLGKGLEYATGYVPVFGSTMSTVSKETFDATVKFATKRAKRTTSLNKCIEDPLNCDPDGITGY